MLLFAAAVLATATPTPVHPEKPAAPGKAMKCMRSNAYIAGADIRYDGNPLVPRRLTELPPASMYVAVDRFDENGCLVPIIVKYNVGR